MKASKIESKSKNVIPLHSVSSSLQRKYPAASEKIGIPLTDGILFIAIQDILYLKAEGNYTQVFLRNDKKYLTSRCLKNFCQYLEPNSFCRIHSAFLINMKCIERYCKSAYPTVIMENGKSLKMSRSGKQRFLAALSWII